MKAYSYLRFSTKKQEWSDSARRQSKAAEDYCIRHGLTLDVSLRLEDRGKSGYTGENLTGNLGLFLDAVRKKKIPRGSILILENLDRLTRGVMTHALPLVLELLESGITIATLAPERRYTSEGLNQNIGVAMEILMTLYLANEESRKKSERVLAEWQERVRNAHKVKLTARCPAWLTLSEDRKSFELKMEAVKIVRKIFKWCNQGYGMHAITARLNNEDVPNFGGRNVQWHISYVKSIVVGRRVLGEFQHAEQNGKKPYGPPIKNYYPAIISEEDWQKAQSEIVRRRRATGPKGKCITNLFTGILRSAKDGGNLTSQKLLKVSEF